MSAFQLDEESTPGAPAAGVQLGYFDSSSKAFAQRSNTRVAGDSHRVSTAALTVNAANTYITDSGLLVPSVGLQSGGLIEWRLSASKTGAGIAAPIYTIKVGSAQSTADTTRLTLTGPAQTAVADIGMLYIIVIVRTGGAAAVLAGSAHWLHRGTAANTTTGGVGFANDASGAVEGTSASFDGSSTIAGQYVSLAIDSGASGVWTVTQCIGKVNY